MEQPFASARALCLRTALAVLLFTAFATAPARAAGVLRGRITDDAGRPLAGVTVVVTGTDLTATSDADGRFEIGGVAAGTYRVEARAVGYTVESREGVEVEEDGSAEVEFQLTAAPPALDEIVVTPSFSLLRDAPLAPAALGREEIRALPHFGDDLYRTIMVLPGVTAGDISARFNVRGGLHDELLVRLDGIELFEPFHLKDFQGVFSILDPETIAGIDLIPGGYTAEFGDRMSGVIDMVSVVPTDRRTSLGLSFSNAWFGSSGTFNEGEGHWLTSLRRGYLDIVLGLADDERGDDEQPSPRYWDLFAKLDFELGARQTLSASVLAADDTLDFEETDFDEFTDVATSFGNAYLRLGHSARVGRDAVVDSRAFWSRVDSDRRGLILDDDQQFNVRDERATDVLSLAQDWQWLISGRQSVKWGFEARSYDTDYDYRDDLLLDNPIDDPRFPDPVRLRRFRDSFSGEHYALYAADRLGLGDRLTVELGLRWDEQTLNDDSQLSPRLNLVYDLGRGGVLRVGWGHFFQSQRPYELDVQFGETTFLPAERAEHWAVGYENRLGRGITLRVDAYRREVTDPLPRYETLFDPFKPLPEASRDLVLIAPERSESQGFEIYLSRLQGRKLGWWLSYANSSVEDELGGTNVPRYIDQPDALTAGLRFHPGVKWSFSWVLTYHSGWPTTALAVTATGDRENRDIDYTVGPFYRQRLDDYLRLDFRASRTSRLGKDGRLTWFVDVLNLTDEENPRGFDISDPRFTERPDGGLDVFFVEETWLGIIPTFGVSWEF